MIRSAFLKLLLAISISAMVALAVMGIYIIALRSDDNPIVAPQSNTVGLPSQAPVQHRLPQKRLGSHPYENPDSPSPR